MLYIFVPDVVGRNEYSDTGVGLSAAAAATEIATFYYSIEGFYQVDTTDDALRSVWLQKKFQMRQIIICSHHGQGSKP